MTKPDLLRPSRDGDQFHYTWAARQSLRLLDERSGLHALVVEAVDPSEQPAHPEQQGTDGSTPLPDGARGGVTDETAADDESDTGDEVIDLAEYWGSSDIDQTVRVVYRQFKHSTRHADEPWTLSFLSKTLLGFARKYRTLKREHPAALERAQFEFISNRAPAQSALEALADLRAGTPSARTMKTRGQLAKVIEAGDIAKLCQRLAVDERAPSLLRLRHLLQVQVSDLLPGAPGEQALLLREMISSRANSIAGDDPVVRRADVLAALKTSEDQLLPATNLIEPPSRPIERPQFAEIATKIHAATDVPTVVHGPGGVGKSVLAGALERHLPAGSVTVVFDCFGNGSYRRPSGPRHRPEQGFVQLVNELAARALCDPIVPSATASEADYARTFLRRLSRAAETLAATAPTALLTLIVDAADNAALIAEEMGERSFVNGLLREKLMSNVRLVVTCRTERLELLGLPVSHQAIPLRGFDLDETRAHLQTIYPSASAKDASEFHARTSHNPRVQAAVLDATRNVQEALAWLAPNPASPDAALDSLIERQVAEIRDRQHGSGAEIDAICVGLAALRPMIPVRVLAEFAGVHASVVLSFVADLGRPLMVDGGSVQFLDEPTETWFRNRYRPTGTYLDSFLARLAPLADRDAYVAASLPALLFEAGRFDELVQLALSDAGLPDNTLPAAERNEVQRREIAQQRTSFALSAALRADRDFEAAQLALRLGVLTAGRTRRLDLIRDNTDLAARFLDPQVLEQLVATRSLRSDWPNSNLPIEGALLAGAEGRTDQARNRLRSATSWMDAWTRQARRDRTPSRINELDILQVAWGLLNTDGAAAGVQFLRAWRPPTLAYDVGLLLARRLLDAGRLSDFGDLARAARGWHLKLAIAQVCAERDVQVEEEVVAHLLRPIMKRKKVVPPSRHDNYRRSTEGDPVDGGLAAATWLITRAVSLGIADPAPGARALRRYLPENLGHRTGSWFDRDIWQPILGFSLCARLEGRELDPAEIQGPGVREAREREKFESSSKLREYRANVEPLVSWASWWLELELNPTADAIADFGRESLGFLERERSSRPGERIDQAMVNAVVRLIARALARHPEIVDHAALLAFCDVNNGTVSRLTETLLVRQAAAHPALHALSSQIASRCHQRLANAREDASELADGFVLLARGTYRVSPEESAVHFQAALDITDAIGDDAWARWEALLAIATIAGQDAADHPGAAYRLGQIAEGVETYIGDYLDYTRILTAAARLSLTETLAIGSRWRDRRAAPIRHLADAVATAPGLLLDADPLAALALLPLGSQYPDNHVLATALASRPEHATSALIVYLRSRRTHPLTRDALDELLTTLGVPRERIEAVDPSLLWTADAASNPAGTHSAGAAEADGDAGRAPTTSFADLDFTTADGWAKGRERARQQHANQDEVFAYVATTLGATPDVLRAFGQCPTVNLWDLSHLLDALSDQPLAMASRAALDGVLVSLLERLAPDYLLNRWRSVDLDQVRAVTGQDTDYAHVASRALANRSGFSAEQAYALAAELCRRLGTAQALRLFDDAAALFDDTAPRDSLDGRHPDGTTGNLDTDTAIAAVIWTALGDPAVRTRWRAAHSVHLVLALGHAAIAARLLDLALGNLRPAVFLDSRLDFYERHAQQWLLFGLSRATVDPSACETAALFEPFLALVLAADPHAVNTPLARDSLLRLDRAGQIQLSPYDRDRARRAGDPVGYVQHDRQTRPCKVSSLSELTAQLANDGGLIEPRHLTRAVGQESLPDDTDDTFHLFFDFRQYWCAPLGDAFGVSAGVIEKFVAEVLIGRWAVPSRGRAEDDPRHKLDLYPRSNYPYKSDWPEEDNLDFYLAVHALYEVAGTLLRHWPVVLRYDEDESSGESEYTRFLESHLPTRSDGRWLADRRDPAPANALLRSESPAGSLAEDRAPDWIYRINAKMFTDEVFPSPEFVTVWASRRVQRYTRSETVRVHTALVTPKTAPALVKALQTAPDWHAYRIPDATDEEYSSTIPGFELTGWIEPHGYASGRDRHDPHAGSVEFPPVRPTAALPALRTLSPDPDYRLWREGDGVVVISIAWDEFDDSRETTGTAGHALTVDRSWLVSLLERLDRWLIVEVEIKRHVDDEISRRVTPHADDDGFRFQQPYTKYLLIDSAGGIHGF